MLGAAPSFLHELMLFSQPSCPLTCSLKRTLRHRVVKSDAQGQTAYVAETQGRGGSYLCTFLTLSVLSFHCLMHFEVEKVSKSK